MNTMRNALRAAVATATAVAAMVGFGIAGATAQAAEPTNSTITLNKAEGDCSVTADQAAGYKAYKLISYIGDDATSGASTTDGTNVTSLNVAANGYTDAITSALAAEGITLGAGETAESALLNIMTKDSANYLGKLARIVSSLADSATGTAFSGASDGKGGVVFNNLENGFYLILPDANMSPAPAPIALSSTFYSATNSAELTSFKPSADAAASTLGSSYLKYACGGDTATKEISTDGGNTWASASSVTVGDTVKFKITLSILDYRTWAGFKVTDTYTGLTAPTNFTAKVGDEDISSKLDIDTTTAGSFTVKPKGWTVPAAGATSADRSVLADPAYSGKTATLTYDQTVTDISGTNKVNVLSYDYNGQPDNPQTPPPTKESDVYTYAIKLKKTNVAGTATLAGASFVLSDSDGKYYQQDTTSVAGKTLWKTDGVTKDTATVFTSGDDGIVTVTGLGAGTYTLTETAAPSGYMLNLGGLAVAPTFTLAANAEDPSKADVTISNGTNALIDTTGYAASDGTTPLAITNDGTGDGSATVLITVKNADSITQLPATGLAGAAEIMLTIVVLFGAGAGIAVVARKARQKAAQAA